jgi:hypothetical protein
MHRFGVPAFVAILFGIFAGCSFAQKAADNQDLTAHELAVNASSRYAQGNYAEAAVRQMRYPLACASIETSEGPTGNNASAVNAAEHIVTDQARLADFGGERLKQQPN